MLKHDRRSAIRATAADRRIRPRLRDLCDEVIASYRVARGAAPVTDDERAEANALLARLAPTLHR